MGSTLSTLRGLLENQIDSGVTSSGTDPTAALLNQYLNIAIRKIGRVYQPRELVSASPTSVSVTANTNTATIPTAMYLPKFVYVLNTSGKYSILRQMRLKDLIDREGEKFFDSTNTGTPDVYAVQGTSFVFNKYFLNTDAAGLKCYGVTIPTTLSGDSDECSLSSDYDLGIIYEAAILYYQKDDDVANQQKYQQLSQLFFNELILSLDTNQEEIVTLNPTIFLGSDIRPSNPAFLYGNP